MFFPAFLIFPVSHRTCVVLHGRSDNDDCVSSFELPVSEKPAAHLKVKAGFAETRNAFPLCYHFYAHGTGSTLYALDGRFKACSIQVRHLLLCDVRHLLFRNLAYLVLVRSPRTLRDGRGPLQQHGRGRCLRDEGERAIGINRDDYGDDQAFLIFTTGLRIKLFAELHNVDLRLTKRGTYRRSRSRLTCRDLKFYLCLYFFRRCHSLNSRFFQNLFLRSYEAAQLLRYLFYLSKLELNRRCAAEDGDHDLQCLAIFVYLIHNAIEVRKWTIGNANRFVLLEFDFKPGLIFPDLHSIDDLVDFVFGQRRGIIRCSYEAGYFRRGLHHLPNMIALSPSATCSEPCQ